MDEPLVRIVNCSKSFEGFSVFEQLNLEIPQGGMTGIVGPNGAGKTTLLRLLTGLFKPDAGSIEVLGCDTIRDVEKLRTLCGYMPQRFGLYGDLTVLQNLHLYADLRGLDPSKKPDVFEKLLHFTGLQKFTGRLARNLSGGMKQKLGLAAALIVKPQCLFLDEPSVGVDPISRRELWKMVQQLIEEGVSALWSTTYLDEAEKCDRILFLYQGKVLFFGPPKELMSSGKSFEDAFIDLLGGLPNTGAKIAESTPVATEGPADAIVAQGLSKKFGSFTAVYPTSFTVKRGEIFGLLGPNGAGKSTTFKMLCGLLKPTEGEADINGINIIKAPSEARRQIGYMAQLFSLYGNLTVLQNLHFFAGIYGVGQDEVEEIITLFKLEDVRHRAADKLSLGFKQQLALAAASLHWPGLLFLDEPSSGMDPVSRREFWEFMKALAAKGRTIMVSTHFMDEAENCDRIALIYAGKIIHLDTPARLKEMAQTEENPHPTLEDAFVQLIEAFDAK